MLRLASFPPNRDEIRVWFDRVGWGQGYGFEAAGAVVRFAFGDASLSTLRSSYAADNIASKKLLLKLGFRPVSTVRRVSRSRGEQITQVRYVLMKPPGGDKTTSKV
ncbi:MAG: GNAT family N-acetyltransferase [Hyphomicrobiales bacterium]|nr:GNAT family N-acetyltransferase [Hyphomicrobiales bacterium]